MTDLRDMTPETMMGHIYADPDIRKEVSRRLKREAAMTKSAILHIDGIGQIDAGTMNTAQQILAAAKESETK